MRCHGGKTTATTQEFGKLRNEAAVGERAVPLILAALECANLILENRRQDISTIDLRGSESRRALRWAGMTSWYWIETWNCVEYKSKHSENKNEMKRKRTIPRILLRNSPMLESHSPVRKYQETEKTAQVSEGLDEVHKWHTSTADVYHGAPANSSCSQRQDLWSLRLIENSRPGCVVFDAVKLKSVARLATALSLVGHRAKSHDFSQDSQSSAPADFRVRAKLKTPDVGVLLWNPGIEGDWKEDGGRKQGLLLRTGLGTRHLDVNVRRLSQDCKGRENEGSRETGLQARESLIRRRKIITHPKGLLIFRVRSLGAAKLASGENIRAVKTVLARRVSQRRGQVAGGRGSEHLWNRMSTCKAT
ncbi:hypothetical protein FB45DRAFT_876957 [Roridomyces roridus]|uniref:Uncharacterized protein n=1 Tax=Roridomyces roridus TaxID=1738132 RepID=A0AAD7F8G0_9AGAR|nr:hypothetical protein FB45DRAFT_876957 [Roridomyces roridus]